MQHPWPPVYIHHDWDVHEGPRIEHWILDFLRDGYEPAKANWKRVKKETKNRQRQSSSASSNTLSEPSIEELRCSLFENMRDWQQNANHPSVIDAVMRVREKRTFNLAVAFGIGSFTSSITDKCMRQLAVFLDISSYLRDRSGRVPRLPFQEVEGILTNTDCQFLKSLGVEVFEVKKCRKGEEMALLHPELQQEVDKNTFLFEAGIEAANLWLRDIAILRPNLLVTSVPCSEQTVNELVKALKCPPREMKGCQGVQKYNERKKEHLEDMLRRSNDAGRFLETHRVVKLESKSERRTREAGLESLELLWRSK